MMEVFDNAVSLDFRSTFVNVGQLESYFNRFKFRKYELLYNCYTMVQFRGYSIY